MVQSSALSRAVGTCPGRRRFDIGSNSSSEKVLYRGRLAQLIAERLSHRANYLPINSLNSDSPSGLPRALPLGGSIKGATLPATTCLATLSWSGLLADQLDQLGLSQQLHKSFVTGRFDIRRISSCDSPGIYGHCARSVLNSRL
jgi:hypothetical protein